MKLMPREYTDAEMEYIAELWIAAKDEILQNESAAFISKARAAGLGARPTRAIQHPCTSNLPPSLDASGKST